MSSAFFEEKKTI